jgi:hypothetical protein
LKRFGFSDDFGFPDRNRAGVSGVKATPNSSLIVPLIVPGVVILILYLINLLPLDGRAKQIARVVVIILGVISLLKYIAVF